MKASEDFTYNQQQTEYIVKLKRRNYWWLLLFLLLLFPLILLITFTKNIEFKVIETGSKKEIAGSLVQFSYTYHSLLSKEKPVILTDTTNEKGIVVFEKVKYTLYEKWFKNKEKCFVVAGNECYLGDSLSLNFHELKHNQQTIVELPLRTYLLNFKVINSENGEPIPEAKIIIKTKFGNSEQEIIDTSDVDGNCAVQAPFCGSIFIKAEKYGYASDSIQETTAKLVNHEKLLKLKPLKKLLKIFVRDLYTKQLVPGAKITLKIQDKTVSSVQTNTNGVGEGVFDNIPLLANLEFLVQKAFYFDTVKIAKASEIVNATDEQRTIYIRPSKQSIVFRNIDAKTGNVLSGVKNDITVNGQLRPNAEYSNNEGVFTITGLLPNDVVSITASKTGYEPNSTKINKKSISQLVNAPQTERDIPLNPVTPPPPPPPPKDDDGFKGLSGDLRINLQWNTFDDLDLFVTDPCGKTVWALELTQSCGSGVGTLDVDANTNRYPKSTWTRNAQENAYWKTPTPGTYTIKVEHCNKQDELKKDPVEFNVTIIDVNGRRDVKGKVSEHQKVFVTTHQVN